MKDNPIKRIHFQKIDSTNTWSKQNVDKIEKGGITLVTAAEQTTGRGRYNHQWISPPNQNIYASFVFFLNLKQQNLGNIPQILALSAVNTLQKYGVHAEIKWPNDLLINGKKLGGVLCETFQKGQEVVFIAGIGLNVNMEEGELKKIDRPATSILAETGKGADIELLLSDLSAVFSVNLERFLKEGFDPFYESFKNSLCYKECDAVQFHNHQKLFKGSFEKINPDGSLKLLLEDGSSKTFSSGEFI